MTLPFSARSTGAESVVAGVTPSGPQTPDTLRSRPSSTVPPESVAPAVSEVLLSSMNGAVDVLSTLAPERPR